MRALILVACAVAVMIGTFAMHPLRAQKDDVFDFIPLGGRSLLQKVFEARPPADDVKALLAGKRTRDEWVAYLKERSRTISGLQALSEKEQFTLADYLSFSMPLPENQVPPDLARANWERILPMDGRDYALEKCQGCHIITVVITQDRPKEHWLGTMSKPSHIGIRLSKTQREALASYLVLNAGIPIDQVPEELRAGGASY